MTSTKPRYSEHDDALTPWESLGAPPQARVRAVIAERVFRHAVRELRIRVRLPSGETLGAGEPDSPVMRIHSPHAFFQRLGTDGKIGFGEGYMAGDWSAAEPAELLTEFAAAVTTLIPRPLQRARRLVESTGPGTERGTKAGAKQNIHRHYDLSNEFFAAFLDETMTYSSGWFAPGVTDLATAQRHKIDHMLDVGDVGSGTRLLEIGTGWGSLALRAAQRGARVTTVTLSAEQLRLARHRIAAAGLDDWVEVRLADYRDLTGQFDAVLSVEMIEAVGHEFWSTFFTAVDRLLAPGGRLGLQAILMPHERMLATRNSYTWIHKYIFPGGQLPSLQAIEQRIAGHTRLRRAQRHSFGASYAETLRCWRDRFYREWDTIRELGFDERFRRMWEFYLAYSEAGFRAEYLDVWQLGYVKPTVR